MARSKRKLIEKVIADSKAPLTVKQSFWRAYDAAHKRRKINTTKRGE